MKMKFNQWLDTLLSEKGIDPECTIAFDGESETGTYNLMMLDVVIEAIKHTGKQEQQAIQKNLIRIDFCNGNIVDYFRHLAKALVY